MKFAKSNRKFELVDTKLYQCLVGSLLYVEKQTRPHILNLVIQLSKMPEMKIRSEKVAKHVLKCLDVTINLRLTFIKNTNMKLIQIQSVEHTGRGYQDDGKSTTAYYFKIRGNGAAISWEIDKEATAALSLKEAEYQAMAAAVQ